MASAPRALDNPTYRGACKLASPESVVTATTFVSAQLALLIDGLDLLSLVGAAQLLLDVDWVGLVSGFIQMAPAAKQASRDGYSRTTTDLGLPQQVKISSSTHK